MQKLFRPNVQFLDGLWTMPKRQSIEHVLAQAEGKEKEYDWLGAVELHKKALNQALKARNLWKAGEIRERIGYCFHKAAMRSENTNEFSERMHLAVANYDGARDFLEGANANDSEKIPRILRFNAMSAFSGFWLTPKVYRKKRLLSECWKLTKQALEAFRKNEDAFEYGKTYNNLSVSAFFGYTFEWKFRVSKNLIKEAMEYGEQAITLLSSIGETRELARAYAKTSIYLSSFGWHFVRNMDERETYLQGAQDYWRRAIELSEEAAFLELPDASGVTFDEINWTFDKMLTNYGRALDYSRRTGDKYLIGTSFEALAYASCWKGMGTSDPDKRQEILQRSLHFAENAKHQFSLISFSSPRGIASWTESPYVAYNWIAASFETDINKRRELLKSAAMYGTDAIRLGERTGYPGIISSVHHCLSMALISLAQIETNTEAKMRLLKKALEHRKKALKIFKQIFPFNQWGCGLNRKFLADLKVELSRFEKDPLKIKKMLKEAVSDQEMGLKLAVKETLHWEKRGELSLYTGLGRNQYSHGESLVRLYDLTRKDEQLIEAVRAFDEAANSFKKPGLFALVAECYWKAAQTQDALTEYLRAAEGFEFASENYNLASEKIPQLGSFYSDYALYMKAWVDIEKSRHGHEKEDYSKAREHYRECAYHLEKTKKWSYLSPYYFAWSFLEDGEALSRFDKPQEAIKAFNEAGRTFGEVANRLLEEGEHLEDSDERNECLRIAKIAGLRRKYCLGRELMEEAVVSNMRGDRISSSEKYSSAAGTFKEISPSFDREEAREDLQFATAVCTACEKMELAEERRDAGLYEKAANLFARASEISRMKTTEITAKGNSCFCQALAMGIKFMATSNLSFYSTAKLHLENAAAYFLKAGLKTLTSYVDGIKKHFDAYAYIGKAEAESDPEKRVKFYLMAEKCLELSAEFFGKARYSGKKKEALENLERVRKERQFAFSLSEVLTAPTSLSSTARVSMPDWKEQSSGLNSFDSANIKASVSAPKEFVPSKEFEIRLDLANVGKIPGLLVRIEGLVPPGCKVLSVPSSCMLEGTSLNMRGRKLEPLSVESVSIWVQILDIDGVTLCPRVVYVDELGNFRNTRSEKVEILPVVEFESKVAQVIFDYLVDAFVEDFGTRMLGLDRSGWRSLPQIIKGARVSKRSLYGVGGRLGHGLYGSQKKGLVNLETFPKERGRGGHILRVRIYHEKESVKRYVREKAPNILT